MHKLHMFYVACLRSFDVACAREPSTASKTACASISEFPGSPL